jgi:hypothetical protein
MHGKFFNYSRRYFTCPKIIGIEQELYDILIYNK